MPKKAVEFFPGAITPLMQPSDKKGLNVKIKLYNELLAEIKIFRPNRHM